MPSVAVRGGVAAAAGRAIPAKPTLSYAGSGTTDNGKFTITNYDANLTYTITNGTRSGSTVTVTNQNTTATVTARLPKSVSNSSPAYPERKGAVQAEYDQSYNPNGDLNTSVNPNTWTCPSGWSAGGGAWGVGICRKYPGSYTDFGGSGYTWSGSDYTNGSGEWWKIA